VTKNDTAGRTSGPVKIPSPMPPVRFDDPRRHLFDPDESNPLELHNFPGIQRNHRLAIASHLPVGLVKNTGDSVGRRDPWTMGAFAFCAPADFGNSEINHC